MAPEKPQTQAGKRFLFMNLTCVTWGGGVLGGVTRHTHTPQKTRKSSTGKNLFVFSGFSYGVLISVWFFLICVWLPGRIFVIFVVFRNFAVDLAVFFVCCSLSGAVVLAIFSDTKGGRKFFLCQRPPPRRVRWGGGGGLGDLTHVSSFSF